MLTNNEVIILSMAMSRFMCEILFIRVDLNRQARVPEV